MTPLWTASLPRHWTVEKLKYLAQVRLSNADKKTVDGEQAVRLCNYVDVYKNDFIVPSMPFMEASATDSQIRELALHAGDVLITKDSEDWTDIAVPAFVPSDLPGVICGYLLAHIRPDPAKAHGSYLFRAFTAQGVADQFKTAANGITRYGVSKDDIASALFPMPPLAEQHSIAVFLDRKTAEIDAVVAKKGRMIELLREERQALISRVVGRGLDANVLLKGSGCLYWGSIPDHWHMKELRHLTPDDRQIMYGIVLPGPHVEEGVPIVKGGNCEPGRLKLEEMSRTTFEIESGYVRSRLLTGDIVYAIRGSYGHAESVPAELEGANLTQDAARISPRSGIDRRWLLYVVRSHQFFSSMDAGATGATIRGVNIKELKRGAIPVPPAHEQIAIATYLDKGIARIDSLIDYSLEQIAKLREYRQTLISAAVTGKYVIPLEETPDFRAAVLAAEIVYRLHDTPHFGRTKLHKGIYGAEHECDLSGIDSDYARLAFGPYDDRLQKAVEREMEMRQWFAVQKGERGRITYVPLAQAGKHRAFFEKMYGDKAAAIARLIDQLRTLNKNKVERAITLYAAWNDFLIRGEAVDDDRLLVEVQGNWHPEKKHKEESWRKSLSWLKSHKLIPHGSGKPTRPTDALTGLRSTAEDEADEDDGDQ